MKRAGVDHPFAIQDLCHTHFELGRILVVVFAYDCRHGSQVARLALRGALAGLGGLRTQPFLAPGTGGRDGLLLRGVPRRKALFRDLEELAEPRPVDPSDVALSPLEQSTALVVGELREVFRVVVGAFSGGRTLREPRHELLVRCRIREHDRVDGIFTQRRKRPTQELHAPCDGFRGQGRQAARVESHASL